MANKNIPYLLYKFKQILLEFFCLLLYDKTKTMLQKEFSYATETIFCFQVIWP